MNDYKIAIGAITDIVNGFVNGTLQMYKDLTISVNDNEAFFQIIQGNNTFSSFDGQKRFIRIMSPAQVIGTLGVPGRTYTLTIMMSPSNMNTYPYKEIVRYTVPSSETKTFSTPPPLPGYEYQSSQTEYQRSKNVPESKTSQTNVQCRYGNACRMFARVKKGRGSAKDIKHTQIWH